MLSVRKYQIIFNLLSDAFLKISLGIVFFNYGFGKLNNLLSGNAEGLINMVTTIPFFGNFPFFFSWILAISETGILIMLLYGLFNFLPLTNIITKIAGVISFIISLVIMYQHIYAWGDNIFSYGPFDFLNVNEGKKSVFGQFLFLPISVYIIFSSRSNFNIINETK